jgi:hypothetical protein
LHITSDVFPMAGLAAMMMSCPPCMPAVRLSRSRKPVSVPLVRAPWFSECSSRSKASRITWSSGMSVLLARFCATSKTFDAA